jgi:ABC-2 type transport system ATP-binding protein
VLLSSHLLAQVEQLCDRVGIFSRGRLIAEGSVRQLAERAGDRAMSLDEVYRRLAAAAAAEGGDGRAA